MVQSKKQISTLSKCVQDTLDDFFTHLDGHKTTNIYEMVMKEIEPPLFKSAMKHTKNNQSSAATLLGISRGTLRKKLKQYKLDSKT